MSVCLKGMALVTKSLDRSSSALTPPVPLERQRRALETGGRMAQRVSTESQTEDNVPFLSPNAALLQLKGEEENRVGNEKRKEICVQGRGNR